MSDEWIESYINAGKAVLAAKKLAEKLGKVDIQLPKWTRNLLYDHLIEFCEDFKSHDKYIKKDAVKS